MKRGLLARCALAILLAGVFGCTAVLPVSAETAGTRTLVEQLARAEQVKLLDQAQFVQIMEELHLGSDQLTASQRWHLRFLDAWQAAFTGHYAEAAPLLKDVADHSGEQSLAVRATALLIQNNFLSHKYEEAYELANNLVESLPGIADPSAREAALNQIIQMMNSVGQYDLALSYARQIKASFPSGTGQCEGNLAETQTLLYAGKLTPDSPDFQRSINACLAVGRVVSANALRLDLASQMIELGDEDRGIALLKKIAPSVRQGGYQIHIASLHVTFAQAYLGKGDDARARASALDALAANGPDNVNWVQQAADYVLYQVEKRAGHDDAALAYFEKYVTQKRDSADDTKARALAYQMVRQDVLAKKMKVDALSKENKILQLRQTLADKSGETGRLYITLLLLVIVFIILWLYRLKHSQLRFREMARHDGLTGAFNRQHFLNEARRILQRLQHTEDGACLILLDLDHFKLVNDTHGHAVGDEVLTRTVAICRRELRGSDLFGRLGGEEFAILMPACSCAQGIEITSRIRHRLAEIPVRLESGAVIKVSASFGLACSSISGYELHQLLSVADAALYRAKRGGRNQLDLGTAEDSAEAGTHGVVGTAQA